jgi:hypothetical protein
MPEYVPEPSIFLVLIPFFIIVAIFALIPFFIDRRFKRSRRGRLTNEQSTAPFSSPEAVGKWTKGLLIATLILAVVAVISGVLEIELLSRMARGYGYTMEKAARNDLRQRLVGILQVLLFYGTAVPFLIWFHRMHKNLPSLGQTGLIFTPGWAVGFFFVPFLNLVRPFQAMREIWRGSDPGRLELDVTSDEPGVPNRLGTPPLVGWWWALYLIFNVVAGMTGQFYLYASKTQSFPELRAASVLMVVADLLLILSALVAIRLVGRLTRWQAQRVELIRQRGGLSAVASAATLTSEGHRKINIIPYVFIGLIGFAIIVMIYLSQTGGRREHGPDQPSYGTKDPSSFSDPPADVDHPQAFDNKLMTFSYPGGWQIVETKGMGETPGVQAQSLAGTFVRLRFDELQADSEAGVDSWSASAQKTYEGFTETGTFDEWGDLTGAGRLLSGKCDGTLHEIRLFIAPITDEQALSVMEMFPLTDADEVEPGLELIRKTFRMTRSPLGAMDNREEPFITPEDREKIKAETARMNTGLAARVTQHSSGVTSYGATVEVINRSTKTFDWVMVQVEFYDKAGQVVSTLKTDARGGDYILPDGVQSFAVSGNGKLDYKTVRASVVYSVEVK